MIKYLHDWYLFISYYFIYYLIELESLNLECCEQIDDGFLLEAFSSQLSPSFSPSAPHAPSSFSLSSSSSEVAVSSWVDFSGVTTIVLTNNINGTRANVNDAFVEEDVDSDSRLRHMDETGGGHAESMDVDEKENVVIGETAALSQPPMTPTRDSASSEVEEMIISLKGKVDDRNKTGKLPLLGNLKHLNLSECKQVTDSTLRFLAENSPNLRTLNVMQCSKLTREGFNVLKQNCAKVLIVCDL